MAGITGWASCGWGADSASVVPGTLTQGTVKSSLGAGKSYAIETNDLGDWPLTTGAFGGTVFPVTVSNPDYNSAAAPNTMIAFGSGGGVTLQFATPIKPVAGEKDLGIFTGQGVALGSGGWFNGNMQAAILVSADDVNWYTLNGTAVASPTTYTGVTYPLNAPTMAYDFGTLAQAWNDGSPGTTQTVLNSLSTANFTHPMVNDDLFNGSGTDVQRLAISADEATADYAAIFGDSGGGNWFDISGSGLASVSYVRLNGDASVPSSGGIRLDAVFANANAVPEPGSLAVAGAAGIFELSRRRIRGKSHG